MQVEPVTHERESLLRVYGGTRLSPWPLLTAPETTRKRLHLKYNRLLSSYAFSFELRRFALGALDCWDPAPSATPLLLQYADGHVAEVDPASGGACQTIPATSSSTL